MEPTGVPNLDRVLGGGLPRGALAIIIGPPGSGKTTLANQIAFAAAHSGRRSVVVTAISEPTSKLLAHLRTFSFFDDRLVGSMIQFMSLEQFMPQGLDATGDELIAIARQTKAQVVVLDGFRGVRGADIDLQAARQFLYDVGTTLSALGVTTVITSEADPRDSAFFPETTTGDVIIGLNYDLIGVLQRRAIEIIKARGAAPLPGLHELALTRAGTIVYPRPETRVATPTDMLAPEEWDGDAEEQASAAVASTPDAVAAFGIPELDALMSGGLARGTSTLLIGSLGTGKTILSLHFAAAGLRAGEPTLYLGFRESIRQLMRKASAFDLGRELADELKPGGKLTIHRWPPVELHPDIVGDTLLETLDRTGARRLVIDSIAELEHAIIRWGDARRISDYMAALIEVLRSRDVTALVIKEHPTTIASSLDLSAGPISVMAENVLLLQQLDYNARLRRVLSVVKMRSSPHDTLLREFVITPRSGIRMVGVFAGGPSGASATTGTSAPPRQESPTPSPSEDPK